MAGGSGSGERMVMSRMVLRGLAVATAVIVAAIIAPALRQDEARYTRARRQMVARQIRARGIKDTNVLRAMSTVPRHLFVPRRIKPHAYEDAAKAIGYGQTISQPYIVALMSELLKPKDTHKVLEVGTGSGYQAAVLAEIVKEVYTIEIIKQLGEPAKKRLADMGYEKITVKVGDGYYGWPEHAPFDSIIVTAAATDIPPPLIEQLKTGGRMVIPIGPPGRVQWLKLVIKGEEGPPTVRNITAVRFVPLTGGH